MFRKNKCFLPRTSESEKKKMKVMIESAYMGSRKQTKKKTLD